MVAAAVLYAGLFAGQAERFFLTVVHYHSFPSPWVQTGQTHSIDPYLPMFDLTASTPEMVLQGAWTVLSWPPVVALLLSAGVLSLALEVRSRA